MLSRAQETRLKESKVLELRLRGDAFGVIAHKVGYANAGSAKKAYDRAVGRSGTDKDMGVRDRTIIELLRLEQLNSYVWGKASRGDLQAVNAARRLVETRAKLLGILNSTPALTSPGATVPAGNDGGTVVPSSRLDEIRERNQGLA